MSGPLIPAVKAGVVVFASGLGAMWAQVELPSGFDGVTSVGLVGFLAVLVGRYTFRQLEDYRGDLKRSRERQDSLEEDLHEAGKARAKLEARNRELEAYAHRLQLWAASITDPGVTAPPPFPE